jgi:hypothetical protein
MLIGLLTVVCMASVLPVSAANAINGSCFASGSMININIPIPAACIHTSAWTLSLVNASFFLASGGWGDSNNDNCVQATGFSGILPDGEYVLSDNDGNSYFSVGAVACAAMGVNGICSGSPLNVGSGVVVLDPNGNWVQPNTKSLSVWSYTPVSLGSWSINGENINVVNCVSSPVNATPSPTSNITSLITPNTPVSPLIPYSSGHSAAAVNTLATLSMTGVSVVNQQTYENQILNTSVGNFMTPYLNFANQIGDTVNSIIGVILGFVLYPVNWIASSALSLVQSFSVNMLNFENSAEFLIAIMCQIVDTIPAELTSLITLYLWWDIIKMIMEGV